MTKTHPLLLTLGGALALTLASCHPRAVPVAEVMIFLREQPVPGGPPVRATFVRVKRDNQGPSTPPRQALVSAPTPAPPTRAQARAEAREQRSEGSIPAPPAQPSGNVRLPDMLGLPGETDFRATNPDKPKQGGSVIARPPRE